MDLLSTEWLFNGWISSDLCSVPPSVQFTEIRTCRNPALPHLLDHIKLLVLTVKALRCGPPHHPRLPPQTLSHSMLNPDQSSCSQTHEPSFLPAFAMLFPLAGVPFPTFCFLSFRTPPPPCLGRYHRCLLLEPALVLVGYANDFVQSFGL